MFIFRNLYSSERCILNIYQRKQTSFDMTLAIKAHFSQNINPHLTQSQYDWPLRRRPVICACAKMVTSGIPNSSYRQAHESLVLIVHVKKTLISLDINSVWSVFAVCTENALAFSYQLNAQKDSDQKGQMPRQVWSHIVPNNDYEKQISEYWLTITPFCH